MDAAIAIQRAFEDDEYTEAVLALRQRPELRSRLQQVVECETELVALLTDMVDESKWRASYSARGIKVLVEDSSDKMIRVRTEGKCSNDLFSMCAALLEVDLYPEWMPGVDEARVLKRVSKFRKILRVSGPKPWPFKRDEATINAYGDMVDMQPLLGVRRRGVAVYLKPADGYPRTKGRHHITVCGGFFIEARADGSYVTMIIRADPHLRYLPTWLVNFVVKNLAYLFVPMIDKHATAFQGRHRDRIDAQPDVYAEIRRRLHQKRKGGEGEYEEEEVERPPRRREAPSISPLLVVVVVIAAWLALRAG